MPVKIFLFLFLLSFPVNAHTFTGMIGFYDGLSHPVLGIDHFLAMVSIGIVSKQIGGRTIWTVPSTFVAMMIIGGILGMVAEIFLLNIRFILSKLSLKNAKKVFVLSNYAKEEKKILYNIDTIVASGAIDKLIPFKKKYVFFFLNN